LRSTRIFQAISLIVALFAITVVFVRALRSIDFIVYYYASRVLIEGHGHLYGPLSGIGFPQYFRYSPLFLLAFLPFALLPFNVAVAVWGALKCVVLYVLVRALARRLDFAEATRRWLVPLLFCGGFLVQEFGGGNVQFLIFALVAASLLLIDGNWWLAAFLLALAISLKVWPLFFVPYIAARRQKRMAMLTLALAAGFTLLPAAYFGWSGNIQLLRTWIAQEYGPGTLKVGMWFPSESLSGVLQRYLSIVDYSSWPDSNYVQLRWFHLDPGVVRWLAIALCGVAYAGLLWMARKGSGSVGKRPPILLTDALAFCGLPLLQPFSHRIEFVVVLWPAMVAGALLRPGFPSAWPRALIYTAVAIEAIQPVIPGATMQRLFQILGVDFWATCLLTAGLLIAWMELRRGGGPRLWRDGAGGAPSPDAYEFTTNR
jgi:glycosyl transferase family 87